MILVPVAIFPDPFRGKDNIIVLCETEQPRSGKALPTNTRRDAKAVFDKAPGEEPWQKLKSEKSKMKIRKCYNKNCDFQLIFVAGSALSRSTRCSRRTAAPRSAGRAAVTPARRYNFRNLKTNP